MMMLLESKFGVSVVWVYFCAIRRRSFQTTYFHTKGILASYYVRQTYILTMFIPTKKQCGVRKEASDWDFSSPKRVICFSEVMS